MKRDDIKEFIELFAGYSKSSKMLAEAPDDDEESKDDEKEEDSKDDEKEEEVKVSKDEKLEFEKSLDDSLEAMFIDIESDALKSAAVQKESYSLASVLLEENEIDLEVFAAETARVIKNADVLLDIEKIILSKARDYLLSKYGEEQEAGFLDIMRHRHNIDHRTEEEKKEQSDEIISPIAVGAGGGEGAG